MSEGDGVVSSSLSDGHEATENPLENYYKLPAVVRRRVRALKKLQYETIKIDANFYKDLLALEIKYDVEHQRVFETRKSIVTGAKEPAEDECDWPSDDEHPSAEGDEVEKLCDEVGKKTRFVDESTKDSTDIKGIPDFWLQTMRNVSLLNEIIQEHDVKILKHLIDIKCVLHSEEPGFTLEFYFSNNDYFSNKVLTKRYYYNYDVSPEDPFGYDGPEIVRTKSCTINWHQGKNVTVKLIKKVQKKKGGGGAKRTITKSVQADSFFNFFDPPTQTLSEDLDEDTQMLLEADFKLGQFMRDSIIPRAVLFFTGEAVLSESDDDDEDDDDDDDEDEESDDDDEEEDDPAPRRGNRHHRSKAPEHAGPTADQPECKQQ